MLEHMKNHVYSPGADTHTQIQRNVVFTWAEGRKDSHNLNWLKRGILKPLDPPSIGSVHSALALERETGSTHASVT